MKQEQTLNTTMKANVYQMVTDRIITQMEKGIIPWQKPWHGINNANPAEVAISYETRRAYSFLNQFLLGEPCDLNIQVESLIAWLKSLRPPQYCENCKLKHSVENWKPSEEQMDALQRAVNKLAKTDIADSVRLSIMYDNLKKLM